MKVPSSPRDPRLELDEVSPRTVPAWIAALPGATAPLPVGSPGKVGVLDLRFSLSAAFSSGSDRAGYDAGRTVLSRRFQKSPLQVIRPHYADRRLPRVPIVQLAQTGGGVVGGDRLRMDIELERGAHAIVTTQGANRLLRAEQGWASQRLDLRVDDNAVLEWMPDVTIPYAGSRFVGEVDAVVASGATLVLGEVLTAGRAGRDARWAAEAFESRTSISRPGGDLLALDRCVFGAEAGQASVALEACGAVGTLFLVSPKPAEDLVAAMRARVDALEGVRAGVSTLPSGGAWARVVGDSPERVGIAVRAMWSAAREIYLGVPAPELRSL